VDFAGLKWWQVFRATILLQRTPQSHFGCNAIPIGAGSQTRIDIFEHGVNLRLGILLPLLCVVLGCAPAQQLQPLDEKARDAKAVLYEQQYRTGSVKAAEQALLDSLKLVQEAGRAGVPFWDPACERCRTEARLVLLYQQQGNPNLAAPYLERLPADFKQCSLKHGDNTVMSMTDSQVVYWATNIAAQSLTHIYPRWRSDLSK